MLAYIVVIILTNSFSILLANIEGVSGKLYYYGFELMSKERLWSSELTFLVFFFGTGFTFALGLLFERAYKRIRRHPSPFKLFYLWGFLLSFTYFFGNIIVGTFFYFGTGVLFEAFSIPYLFRIVIGVGAFATLAYLGVYATRGILISLNSYQRLVERHEMSNLIKAQILYPAIIGNVFILFLKVPMYNYVNMLDALVWLMLFIPITALLINLSSQKSIRFNRKADSIRIYPRPIIFFVIIALIYRFGLIKGLEF
jgi:hypothetical protein